MTEMLHQRDPVELLADEFASRLRRGEQPSVSEYAAEHPRYAERIAQLLPAVAMMEQLRAEERARCEATTRRTGTSNPPDRLGDFDIVQEIGRGGMGIVYEAEQRSLARRVAVKILPTHALLLDKHLKRFEREARTAAGLHHTNIVPVFGVGSQDGLHYYVMPLVRGVGLDEIVRELRRAGDCTSTSPDSPQASVASVPDVREIARALAARRFKSTSSMGGTQAATPPDADPPASAAGSADASRCRHGSSGAAAPLGSASTNGRHGDRRERWLVQRSPRAGHWAMVACVGVQAAEALHYAHAQGTLHRDIKPGNLLVDAEGVVCLADFGLARTMDHSDASCSGEVVGTLRYMAPEQLRGDADARSDIYALGLTLYELLTLRPALEETDRRRCLRGVDADREPSPPRAIDSAIPRDLETIILKCIASDPSKRYQSAAALAADLRRFLEDKPIRARRASSLERAWRWCRRNPALAAMSGLAALLVIAVAATASSGYAKTRKAYDGATAALSRAEATSRLALDALEDIYLQLSPDRVWITSDSDLGGDACACIGLRSGAAAASSADRPLFQVQASKETAAVLENLLVFYDRLAEEVGEDFQIMLESAIASRRVGDIRQRLGQLDEAESEYARAIGKLAALRVRAGTDAVIPMEIARNQNEIGNVRSARFEPVSAYQSHEEALSVLQDAEPTEGPLEEFHYELARTLYFLASKRPGRVNGHPQNDAAATAIGARPHQYAGNEYRRKAIRILEELARENQAAPDYRFLLALCHRPSGFGPVSARSGSDARGRRRAIQILEELKANYPGVADYRYELTATYAWIHVGLFPWQGPSAAPAEAEASLLKAYDESQWLVAHNPTIPHYTLSEALILAKLGTLCWRSGRLEDAERYFNKALETQGKLITEFPDLPPHNRVLLEFIRLRLSQVRHESHGKRGDSGAADSVCEMLQASVEKMAELTKRPELAEDRLAWSALPIGYETLSRVLGEMGDNDRAREAERLAKSVRRAMPHQRSDPWQQ